MLGLRATLASALVCLVLPACGGKIDGPTAEPERSAPAPAPPATGPHEAETPTAPSERRPVDVAPRSFGCASMELPESRGTVTATGASFEMMKDFVDVSASERTATPTEGTKTFSRLLDITFRTDAKVYEEDGTLRAEYGFLGYVLTAESETELPPPFVSGTYLSPGGYTGSDVCLGENEGFGGSSTFHGPSAVHIAAMDETSVEGWLEGTSGDPTDRVAFKAPLKRATD